MCNVSAVKNDQPSKLLRKSNTHTISLFSKARALQSYELDSANVLQNNIVNTLTFLSCSSLYRQLFYQFEQHLVRYIYISAYLLQYLLDRAAMDNQLKYLLLQLLMNECRDTESRRRSIRQLAGTAKQYSRDLCKILLFWHWLRKHYTQFKAVLKHYEAYRIGDVLPTLPADKYTLLKAKLLTSIAMISLKGSQQPSCKYLQAAITERKKYHLINNVDLPVDYYHTTWYLTIKMLYEKNRYHNFESKGDVRLLRSIDEELRLLGRSNYYNIMKNVYEYELKRLRSEVVKRVEYEYFEKERYQYEGIHMKLTSKRFARIKRTNSSACRTNSARKIVYNETVSHLTGGKLMAKLYEYFSLTKQQLKQHRKVFRTTYKSLSVGTARQKMSCPTLKALNAQVNGKKKDYRVVRSVNVSTCQIPIMEYSYATSRAIYESYVNYDPTPISLLPNTVLPNSFPSKHTNSKCTSKLHKKNIKTVYNNFACRRILRRINTNKLYQYLDEPIYFYNYNYLDNLLSSNMIYFSPGMYNGHPTHVLTNSKSLNIEFIKLWQGRAVLSKIELDLRPSEIHLYITLSTGWTSKAVNSHPNKYKLILTRSNNFLCERYVTIWPTIRYMLAMKFSQFVVLKNYLKTLVQRKHPEISKSLGFQQYCAWFGSVDNEYIEYIDICFDSIFKMIKCVQMYTQGTISSIIHVDVAKLGRLESYRIMLKSYEGQKYLCYLYYDCWKLSMKSAMHLYVFLTQNNKLKLCSFFIAHDYHCYLVEAWVTRDNLITTINSNTDLYISLYLHSLQYYIVRNILILIIPWQQLYQYLMRRYDYIHFVCLLINHQHRVNKFLTRLLRYLINRVIIVDSLDGKVLKDTRRDTCKLTNKIFSLHYSDKLVNKDSMSSSAKVHIVSNHKYVSIYCTLNIYEISLCVDSKWKSAQRKILQMLQMRVPIEPRYGKSALKVQVVPEGSIVAHAISAYTYQLMPRQKIASSKEIMLCRRTINGELCLIKTSITTDALTHHWLAEFEFMKMRNKQVDKFIMSSYDFQVITRIDKLSKKKQNKGKCVIEENENKQKNNYEPTLSVQIMHLTDCFSYSRNSYIPKIFLFKNNCKYKMTSKRIGNNRKLLPTTYGYLTAFQYTGRVLLKWPYKLHKTFIMLSIAEQWLNYSVFWYFRVNIPRSYSHFVLQLTNSYCQKDFPFLKYLPYGSSSKQIAANMRSMLHKTEVNLDWTTRRCSVTLNDFAYELKERVLCEYLGHKLLECYLTPTDIQIIVSNTKQYCMMHHEVGSTIDRETAFRLYSLYTISAEEIMGDRLYNVCVFLMRMYRRHLYEGTI